MMDDGPVTRDIRLDLFTQYDSAVAGARKWEHHIGGSNYRGADAREVIVRDTWHPVMTLSTCGETYRGLHLDILEARNSGAFTTVHPERVRRRWGMWNTIRERGGDSVSCAWRDSPGDEVGGGGQVYCRFDFPVIDTGGNITAINRQVQKILTPGGLSVAPILPGYFMLRVTETPTAPTAEIVYQAGGPDTAGPLESCEPHVSWYPLACVRFVEPQTIAQGDSQGSGLVIGISQIETSAIEVYRVKRDCNPPEPEDCVTIVGIDFGEVCADSCFEVEPAAFGVVDL